MSHGRHEQRKRRGHHGHHGHHGHPTPHGPDHGPHGSRGMRGPHAWRMRHAMRQAMHASVRGFVRRRLHRRIFAWFGASILATGVVVWTVLALTIDRSPWSTHMGRATAFVGNRMAEVWTDPAARQHFTRALARDLDVQVTIEDAAGNPIPSLHATEPGTTCHGQTHRIPVPGAGSTTPGALGHVTLCQSSRFHARSGWAAAGALFTACLCLWLISGRIARRLVRPLGEIVRVARDIGNGKLASRARPGRHDPDELGVLGAAINHMAARIEKQLADQRQLLAAVSHEIRTPLGHMRVLLEIARDSAAPAPHMDELEREILAVDSLVGQLLASSRLEFDTIEPRDLDARILATSALERAGLDPALLRMCRAAPADAPAMPGAALDHHGADTAFRGDPTLLARALANLIENARTHGNGVTALLLTVRQDGDAAEPTRLDFEVLDHGPGFTDTDPERVFDPFYRGKPSRTAGEHAALGLGLALVRRIARAHGGDAWARNRQPGDPDDPGDPGTTRGARVGFSITPHPPAAPDTEPGHPPDGSSP